MTDTPETDAVMKQHTEHSQNWLVIEMTNMSRKLERERDAYKAEAYKYIELWDRSTKELESLKSNTHLND